MITLSTNFERLAQMGSQDKVYLLKLESTGTDLYFSTKTIYIDSQLYLPMITAIQTTSSKWNLSDGGSNNVTISAPKVTIKTETTVDGYNLTDEFYNNAIIGNKASIWLGYSSFTVLTDFAKVGDFIIDDIEQDKETVQIAFKTPSLPDVEIAGSVADVKTGKIGNNTIPTGNVIHKEMDGKRIPLIFGRHWAAPMQPLLIDEEGNIKYYFIDYDYNTKVAASYGYAHFTSGYHFNEIASSQEYFYIKQDVDFAILPKRIWWDSTDSNGIDTAYEVNYSHTDVGGYMILYGGNNAYGSLSSDNTFFINTPMRFTPYTEGTNYFIYQSGPSETVNILTGGYGIDRLILDDHQTNPVLTLHAQHIDDFIIFTYFCHLDRDYNIRHDSQGIIYETRLINLPATSNFSQGSGFAMGRMEKTIAAGGAGASTYTPLYLYEKDEYDPTTTYNDDTWLAGTELLEGSFQYEDSYNHNTRVMGTGTGYVLTNWLDTPTQGTSNVSQLKYLGADYISRGVGYNTIENNYQNFTIETFNKTPRMLAKFQFYCDGTNSNPTDYKVYMLSACWGGSVGLSYGDPLSASMVGMVWTVDAVDTILEFPYQYLQTIIEGKLSAFGTVGTTFNSTNWELLFGDARTGSGFVITDSTKFKSFIDDYVKYEPFTVFQSLSDKFEMLSIAPTYEEADQDGKLDYNDAMDFTINFSDKDNIIAEIKTLKTDYASAIDKYNYLRGWKLDSTEYDFAKWRVGNTSVVNQFFIEKIEKKYTSFPIGQISRVSRTGKYYFAVRNNLNIDPATDDGTNWRELVITDENYASTLTAWSSATAYLGIECENRAIASYILNMYANRKRIVTFKTADLSYMKYQLGDIVGFENCPYKLLGMSIAGFAGNSDDVVSYNEQDHYSSFIITGIKKESKYVEIEAMQLVDLAAYNIIEQPAMEAQ